MAAYKYVQNKNSSDETVSFSFKKEDYRVGDVIDLNEQEYLKLSSRFVLEPVVKPKEEKPNMSIGAKRSIRSSKFGGDDDTTTINFKGVND